MILLSFEKRNSEGYPETCHELFTHLYAAVGSHYFQNYRCVVREVRDIPAAEVAADIERVQKELERDKKLAAIRQLEERIEKLKNERDRLNDSIDSE